MPAWCLRLFLRVRPLHRRQRQIKIGVINTFAFGDEKLGITKYVNAAKSLDAEFAPAQLELETMAKKLSTLGKEIQTLREQAGKVPIDEKAATCQGRGGRKTPARH